MVAPTLMEATSVAVLEVSTEPDRGERPQHICFIQLVALRLQAVWLNNLLCFPCSHCMSGSGFSGQFVEGDEEDSLSPEACYECKINGGAKSGRHRRDADENEIKEVREVTGLCS